MNDELRDAIAESFLAPLPADAVAPLFEHAVRVLRAAGTRSQSDSPLYVNLTVSGLVRIARQAPDGRSVTQRYLRRGDIGGVPTAFKRGGGGHVQAIVATVQYLVPAEVWREVAQRDGRVAYALLEEMARILGQTFRHLADGSLMSTRQRVARELLLAAGQDGPELVAPLTQQQLADGVGTAREVVARALGELRDRGAITTTRHGIVIVDAAALRSELDTIA